MIVHRYGKAMSVTYLRNESRLHTIGERLQRAAVLATLTLAPLTACASSETDGTSKRSLRVTASAYNSTPGQTNENPTLAAWGDTLTPGTRAIAVSRDLIALGLDHGVSVRIEGLDGDYTVLDKMAARWEKKIDIYMGEDVAAAREWGTREVTIHWDGE